MDWVKLATRYYADDKVAALPDADTELLFVRGLARAGEEERSGFIPESAVPELARRRRHAACVDALMSAGLWSRVDGGYQITRWTDWQEELDALAKRRAADRERQRRRRAAAREETRDPQTPVDNPNVSRDNGRASRDTDPLSRDLSRDVTPPEGDVDREVSGTGRGVAQGGRPAGFPPSERCPAHADAPADGPCGPCGDARRLRQQWETDRSRDDALRRSMEARERAELRRAEIARCQLCDDRGYLPSGHQCTHDPDRVNGRGAAAAREILQRKETPRA